MSTHCPLLIKPPTLQHPHCGRRCLQACSSFMFWSRLNSGGCPHLFLLKRRWLVPQLLGPSVSDWSVSARLEQNSDLIQLLWEASEYTSVCCSALWTLKSCEWAMTTRSTQQHFRRGAIMNYHQTKWRDEYQMPVREKVAAVINARCQVWSFIFIHVWLGLTMTVIIVFYGYSQLITAVLQLLLWIRC